MTEKRFVNIAKEPIFIVVNDTFEDEVLADDDVVDCLNELSDKNGQLGKENEQLKSELGEKDIQIDFLKSENIHMSYLVNENNQLKSELKALRKKYNDFSDMVDKRLKEMDRELVK